MGASSDEYENGVVADGSQRGTVMKKKWNVENIYISHPRR